MDERKSVCTVVDDEQMSRVRGALEEVTSLIDSLRLGCEIAYLREPTQAEGDAHEYRNDQSMGASYGANECFVPMGGHHGWKCNCGTWVWGGPTVCQRCVDREAVKVALEWMNSSDSSNAALTRAAHDELREWREQGRAPAGSCPFCASRISVVERDGVFVARCSHRGCGARGPKHHDLTRACDLFCCPPQRTAGGMGGIDAGGVL